VLAKEAHGVVSEGGEDAQARADHDVVAVVPGIAIREHSRSSASLAVCRSASCDQQASWAAITVSGATD